MPDCDLVIVGGGFSGLMTATQAVRSARRRLSIVWADRTGRFARGTAYGTTEISHLLNVPAGKMSAWPDKPGDLLRWLAPRHPAYGPHSFVPRKIYGDYLADIMADMLPRANVHTITAAAIAAHRENGKYRVEFADGTFAEAPCLVLATGNPPPPDPGWPEGERFIRDFWGWRLAGGRMAAHDGGENGPLAVILGTGLTTVDAVISLRADGYKGKILAVSPHGKMPQVHGPQPPKPQDFSAFAGTLKQQPAALAYLRAFRKNLSAAPHEWRALADSIRADTPMLWQALNEREKGRFARHLLSSWNNHRHRMAPEIKAKLAPDRDLSVMAGRVVAVAADGTLSVRARGDDGVWNFHADTVINCAGPALRTLTDENPLLASLRRQDLISPGPLRLGIATPRAHGVFALGTPLTGERLETVAVPELRQQAADTGEALSRII